MQAAVAPNYCSGNTRSVTVAGFANVTASPLEHLPLVTRPETAVLFVTCKLVHQRA